MATSYSFTGGTAAVLKRVSPLLRAAGDEVFTRR